MIANNLVGLSFLLEGSHRLMVGLHPSEVERVFGLWQDCQKSRDTYSGTCLSSSTKFCVDLAKVVGMHTFDMNDLIQQQQKQSTVTPRQNFQGTPTFPFSRS